MINKVILLGRVGSEPAEKNYNNKVYWNFSLATQKKFKNANGETKTLTTWHNIVCANKPLNEHIIPMVKKGDMVYLEGTLVHSEASSPQKTFPSSVWLNPFDSTLKIIHTSSNDSNNKVMTEDEILPSKLPQQSSSSSVAPTYEADTLDDDVPF